VRDRMLCSGCSPLLTGKAEAGGTRVVVIPRPLPLRRSARNAVGACRERSLPSCLSATGATQSQTATGTPRQTSAIGRNAPILVQLRPAPYDPAPRCGIASRPDARLT